MNGLEIEVKFFVAQPEDLLRRISASGAVGGGRHFERNWIFDSRQGLLATRGELLRLRHDTAWHVTYKRPVEGGGDQFKVRQEMETTLADGDVLRAVFQAVGLETVRIYEKWRETFRLEGAHLCLDQLPFGTFLEIEADGAHIRSLAGDLGLDWRRRIRGTYLDLFQIVADEMRLGFDDITFANFQGLTVDMQRWRQRYEAG